MNKPYDKRKDGWFTFVIVGVCLLPITVLAAWAVIIIHFLVKFW